MTNIIFEQLNLANRALIIAKYASYLETVEHYGYWANLYSLNSLYIEIYYNPLTRIIDGINICSYESLDKYLNRITIKQ